MTITETHKKGTQMKRLRFTKIWLAAAAATIVSIGGVSLAVADQHSASAPSGDAMPASAAQVSEIDAKLLASFALFRDDQATGAVKQESGKSTAFGLNAALARTAQTPSGPVDVVPGQDRVCTEVPLQTKPGIPAGLSINCASIDAALEGRAVSALQSNDGQATRITGLVPDAVTAVRLVGGSEPTEIPVQHNVWSTGPTDATSAELVTSGATLAPIKLPSS